MNRGATVLNKTGYKNIYKARKSYRVQIMLKGKIVYNKTYKSLNAAILGRNKQLKIWHGDFANVK